MIQVKLSQEVIDSCMEFVDTRTKDSAALYGSRGEARNTKIYKDILYGVLAEFAISSLLANCSKPDLTIYTKKQKSYAKDLEWNGLHLHVKSQGAVSAKRYGLSWIFQRTDPVVSKPAQTDILALCCVQDDLTVDVYGFLNASQAQFKELKVFQYRNSKTALYFEDILCYIKSVEDFKHEFNNTKEESPKMPKLWS